MVVNLHFSLLAKFKYHLLLRSKHPLVPSQTRHVWLLLLKLSFSFALKPRSDWVENPEAGHSGTGAQDCLYGT